MDHDRYEKSEREGLSSLILEDGVDRVRTDTGIAR